MDLMDRLPGHLALPWTGQTASRFTLSRLRTFLMSLSTATPAPVSLPDLQFIAARASLLDVASFLDRVQRHGQDGDYRIAALRAALPHLLEGEPRRARRILESLSDPTTEPIPAATIQGAFGAPRP